MAVEAAPLRVGETTLATFPFGELLEVVLQQDQLLRVITRDRGVRG